ncbi:hypothetical protein HPB51_020268 [Rhipicephalus microplus]|uniref:Lipocalin n=1 Tax=Rhipicephalus microplus TaxID=6941 RepID=A0A9J6EU33_RHIMP|nr:hypothetical protein HPB51_020268 [Rhipicephalus microplus]
MIDKSLIDSGSDIFKYPPRLKSLHPETSARHPSVRECKLYYADENCVVADMEYNGHQCILWIRRRLKDTVPQVCKDEFVDTCGVVIAPHRRDLCDDGEGDY